MRREILLSILLFGVLILYSFSTVTIDSSKASPDTVISLSPLKSSARLDTTFTVDITITDVYDLQAWEVRIAFDPTILNAISAIEDLSFLYYWADYWGWTTMFGSTVDNAVGTLIVFNSYVPMGMEGEGATSLGTEVLATVTFNVTGLGKTALDLHETKLIRIVDPKIQTAIEHTATDGKFFVADINHDGEVNATDLSLLKNAYGSIPSSPNWNTEADISNDKLVATIDLYALGKCYGST